MKSDLGLATVVVACFLSPTFASPSERSAAVWKRDNPPDHCIPSGAASMSNYVWMDLSEDCQWAGVATSCCLTAQRGSICNIRDRDDFGDLQRALGKQISKDGWFDSSKSGRWTANYEIWWSSPMDPEILQIYYHYLGDPNDENSYAGTRFDTMSFTAVKKGGMSRIHLNCDPWE